MAGDSGGHRMGALVDELTGAGAAQVRNKEDRKWGLQEECVWRGQAGAETLARSVELEVR